MSSCCGARFRAGTVWGLVSLRQPPVEARDHRLLALGVLVSSQDLHLGDRPGPAPGTVHTPAPRRADGWPQSVQDGRRRRLPPCAVSLGGWSSGIRGADPAGSMPWHRGCSALMNTNTGQCGSSATRPPRPHPGVAMQASFSGIQRRPHYPEHRVNRIAGYLFNASGGKGAGSYFQEKVRPGQWIHLSLS